MVNVIARSGFKRAWAVIEPGLLIKTDEDYKKAVKLLDQLLDEVGNNVRHPYFNFLEVLGTLIENYERDHVEMKDASGKDVLKFLMEQHDLSQQDLPEVGSQGVVSEILSGKRELNTRQIKTLSKKFGVSPAVFF